MKFKSKAHANIALIKYWGKENEELIIPKNNSLSLTLDSLYTETEVAFIDGEKDVFYLDDELQDERHTLKISKFIDLFRKKSNNFSKVLVKSYNHVPTAAGLASSASGFSALAVALNELFELNLNKTELSKYARRGSGSASRSIFGGFVEWKKGYDDETSYAEKVDDANWDVAMIILVLNDSKKEISSREAMKKTIETSPLYKGFTDSSIEDIKNIKEAIKNRDFKKMGEIAEHNAMKMHATMLSSNPSIMYFKPDSIRAIEKIKQLRKDGFDVYYTMDAGPNVKILCRDSQIENIVHELKKDFDSNQIIISKVGNDASVREIK
ncbi:MULTISPECIES: diphosphomevalonate decarboxylase [Helcococcus]|uniref:diphosphomevalonate decarboxylase n=1 Tax=Helcococcus bovis TaxID=3153252 RepID=A0ABW9F802_9FIRM